MQLLTIFAGLVALVWGISKLSAPWRKYYEEHIAPQEKELAAAETRLAERERSRRDSRTNAELFTRDFRAEVLRHQKAKSVAYEILNPLLERKAKLHEEMDDVRDRLNRWHQSSKSFFGNKGQKIKDDSILGWFGLQQTVAQKESLERRRASISSEIGSLKDELSVIFEHRINPAKKGIKAAFDDQKRLKRFRQDGLNEWHFCQEVKRLETEIGEIKSKILHLQASISDAQESFKKHRKSLTS